MANWIRADIKRWEKTIDPGVCARWKINRGKIVGLSRRLAYKKSFLIVLHPLINLSIFHFVVHRYLRISVDHFPLYPFAREEHTKIIAGNHSSRDRSGRRE